MKQTEADLREAVIAVLSDMLAGLAAHPQPVDALTVETEWAGLAQAEPPAPSVEPPQRVPAPWPEGSCPRHNKEWSQGAFGPYDKGTREDDKRYANAKGYCKLRPGDIYQGRLIPRLAA